MNALPYILPWFLMVLAIGLALAVKMLPIKSVIGMVTVSVLGLLMLLTGIFQNVISAQLNNQLQTQSSQIAEQEAWKYRHLDELALTLSQFLPPEDQTISLLQRLTAFGWKTSDPHFQAMQDANNLREQIMANYTSKGPMLFKGIPLSVDDNILNMSLRQVGFTVIPYQADETAEAEINILYFGRDMDIDEVKLAALTLMRAGVSLRGIKPFPKATRGNLRALKAEFNKYYRTRQRLTPDDIQQAKAFN